MPDVVVAAAANLYRCLTTAYASALEDDRTEYIGLLANIILGIRDRQKKIYMYVANFLQSAPLRNL